MFTKFRHPSRVVLLAFILLNIILGLFIVDDFGISKDEGAEMLRASLAYQAYSNDTDVNPPDRYTELIPNIYYGTAITAVGYGTTQILSPIIDNHPTVFPHFIYYLSFQIGLVAFYFLAAQFIPEWTALLLTFIFGTQPVFFGHAFVNPKDIPLLAVFLATVAAGFYAVDHLAKMETIPAPKISLSKREKIWIGVFAAVLAILVLRNYLFDWVSTFITYAHEAPETHLAHRILSLVIDSPRIKVQLAMGDIFVNRIYLGIAIFIAITFLIFCIQIWRHKIFRGWVTLPIVLAGGIWGFANATRVLALAAGGMVGLYALLTLGKRAVPYMVSYVLAAVPITYICWPFLWYFGIPGLLDALLDFSDFSWANEILFEGQIYTIYNLPSRYLPKLMLLQFTEPVVLLAAAGLVISILWMIQKKLDWKKISLLYAWFALPLIYTLANNTVTYNNFRQYFFITPPLFILAGLALHAGLSKLKGKYWHAVVGVALVLPAVISLIQLHPYEYIYYNQFTGGVPGAYRQYELDYWSLSGKEIAEYINANLPAGSRILIAEPPSYLRNFTNPEFEIVGITPDIEDQLYEFDYAALSTSDFLDLRYFPDAEIIYQVESGGGVLFVLKKIN